MECSISCSEVQRKQTHDAFSASYCNRILFIKDGQVFNELHRGTDTRKEFFTKILEVVSVLGGEQSEHM